MTYDHAIVLGGSITGLLAAAALSSEFERVTIIDRDELVVDGPAASRSRRGVPQGDQVHHLLALGGQKIDELLPGLDAELVAAGGEKRDNMAAFAQFTYGVWRARFESDLQLTNFRRPVFEWVIRRRVLALPNVAAHKGLATGLTMSEDGSTVLGAKVKNAPGGEILGDLVVDATGRGTKTPRWLEDAGFTPPTASHLRVYMGYTGVLIDVPEGTFPPGISSIACAPTSDNKSVGMAIWPCGDGQHILVAMGTMRNYPPTDYEGLIRSAEQLPTPLLAQYLRASTPITTPQGYQMAGDQRLRWEDMDRRPENFVAMGDAVASYNPTYGQGMTMAAVGAVELRRVLRDSGGEITGVADTFQKALSPHVDIAWDNAVRIDSVYEGVEYENMEPPAPAPAGYAEAFVGVQSEDPEVALAARKATLWMDNSYLQTESVQGKIAAWMTAGRQASAAASNPLAIPALTQV